MNKKLKNGAYFASGVLLTGVAAWRKDDIIKYGSKAVSFAKNTVVNVFKKKKNTVEEVAQQVVGTTTEFTNVK